MDWALINPLIVATIALTGAIVTNKAQNRGRPENALIDQLQENMASMRHDITDLKLEQQKSRKRELIRDDYINKLRRHIEDGNPPPAPDWPAGLYD